MKAGIGWPIAVACILGATVTANIVVMRIANDDPSFAIEPDYYRKAVHFDSSMAQSRQNLALGWQFDARFEPITSAVATPITVRAKDAAAAPLTGATIMIVARFNARANDTLTTTLVETSPGEYRGVLPMGHPGEWEVRVNAERQNEHYSASTRVNAVRAVVAPVPTPLVAKPQ